MAMTLLKKLKYIMRKISPVVKIASISLLLNIVARLDLELHQMDMKITFLNGELNEEVYMEQHIG